MSEDDKKRTVRVHKLGPEWSRGVPGEDGMYWVSIWLPKERRWSDAFVCEVMSGREGERNGVPGHTGTQFMFIAMEYGALPLGYEYGTPYWADMSEPKRWRPLMRPDPNSRRHRLREADFADRNDKGVSLDDMLDELQVDTMLDGPGSTVPKEIQNWNGVSDDHGIFAFFARESDAAGYRLYEINRRLNGRGPRRHRKD